DMGFLLVAFAAVIAIRGRAADASGPLRRRLRRPPGVAYALVILGILGYLLATELVIPAFAPSGRFAYWQYNALGNDLPAGAVGLVTAPWHAVATFFAPFAKSFTLLMLLLPLTFVPLRSPYALLALPLLGERFFNSRNALWV